MHHDCGNCPGGQSVVDVGLPTSAGWLPGHAGTLYGGVVGSVGVYLETRHTHKNKLLHHPIVWHMDTKLSIHEVCELHRF